jgi:hypothetical protein
MEFGLSRAFAGTLQGRINVVFAGVVISLGSNSGTPLYLNPQARVNTILTCFGRSSMPDARTQARDQVKFYGHL